MSWQGWVLRVDLNHLRISREPLNRQWAEAYLGQRGLASKYLFEEVDPSVDPLSPGNKLIFATGPLTGTMASTGGRWSAVTKGALTGAIAASNAGGFFGAELKFAGLDLIIMEGRAPKPVYLSIVDEEVELIEAGGSSGANRSGPRSSASGNAIRIHRSVSPPSAVRVRIWCDTPVSFVTATGRQAAPVWVR